MVSLEAPFFFSLPEDTNAGLEEVLVEEPLVVRALPPPLVEFLEGVAEELEVSKGTLVTLLRFSLEGKSLLHATAEPGVLHALLRGGVGGLLLRDQRVQLVQEARGVAGAGNHEWWWSCACKYCIMRI